MTSSRASSAPISSEEANEQTPNANTSSESDPNTTTKTVKFDNDSYAIFARSEQDSSLLLTISYACPNYSITDTVRITSIVKYLVDSDAQNFNIIFSMSKEDVNILAYRDGVVDDAPLISKAWQEQIKLMSYMADNEINTIYQSVANNTNDAFK